MFVGKYLSMAGVCVFLMHIHDSNFILTIKRLFNTYFYLTNMFTVSLCF